MRPRLMSPGHDICAVHAACWTTAGLLLAGVLAAPPPAGAMTAQEAILRAKPAAVLVISRVSADVIVNCGGGSVRQRPTSFAEAGSGWFVDGRGYVVTNAHVVLPPAAVVELKRAAIEENCADSAPRAQSVALGQRSDTEERIRPFATNRATAMVTTVPSPSVTVILPNGSRLSAEVKKFSPGIGLDAGGAPQPGSGRDLALLRVAASGLPALDIATRESQIGDAVHVLGFPNLVLTHEFLDRTGSPEASVTNGAISGFRLDAIGQRVVQTDAPAAYGSSGSPVIGSDGMLVGVMTLVSPSHSIGSVVQGFNFLIPARDVRSFLDGTDVRIGESPFNRPWAEALSAFFKADYRVAAAKLATVEAMLPDLPDVKRVRGEVEVQDTVDLLPSGRDSWPRAMLAVSIAGLGLCGGLVGLPWWKRPFKVALAQGIRVGRRLSGRPLPPRPVMLEQPVARNIVQRIRRGLAREFLRQRLVDLIQAEQLLGHYVGPSQSRIAEVSRLIDVLAGDEDDVATAGAPVARLGSGQACVAGELGMGRPGQHGSRDLRAYRPPSTARAEAAPLAGEGQEAPDRAVGAPQPQSRREEGAAPLDAGEESSGLRLEEAEYGAAPRGAGVAP